MLHNPYLSEKEQLALSLLAEERSYGVIKRECGLTSDLVSYRLPRLPLFMAGLRKKTGIKNLRMADDVKEYLADVLAAPGPNEQEASALRRLAGIGAIETAAKQIGPRMGLSEEEGLVLLAKGRFACGIFARDEREQRMQIRTYFIHTEGAKNAHLLNDNHLAVLRLYAQGLYYATIAETLGPDFSPKYVIHLIEQGVERLGCTVRGRGAQRKLVGIALAAIDAQSAPIKPVEITMSDPLF